MNLSRPYSAGWRQGIQGARRLLNLKDQAHYGLFDIGGSDLLPALRHQLVLGNSCGELRAGTPLFGMWRNHLRLWRDDVIIDLYAENVGISQDRLKVLAEDTVLI